MKERRKFPRVDFELKLRIFENAKSSQSLAEDCHITNISKVGISFITHKKFHVGQEFFMKFELLDGLDVSFNGEITWQKGNDLLYSYGVRYTRVGWLSQRNLEKGLLSKFFPEEKNILRSMLEYALLILAIVLLSRFLNQLPLAYTIGIFLGFIGIFYFALLKSH